MAGGSGLRQRGRGAARAGRSASAAASVSTARRGHVAAQGTVPMEETRRGAGDVVDVGQHAIPRRLAAGEDCRFGDVAAQRPRQQRWRADRRLGSIDKRPGPARRWRGGSVERNASRTVLRAIPNRLAIASMLIVRRDAADGSRPNPPRRSLSKPPDAHRARERDPALPVVDPTRTGSAFDRR
jgi:hypothetical protein